MQNRWVPWLLAAAVGLQLYTLNRVSEMGSQLNHLSNQVRGQESAMQNALNNVQQQVRQVARANEWVLDLRDQSKPGPGCNGAQITLDWNFRELPPGARPVQLLYRRPGQAWQTVPATPTGPLAYRAVFQAAGAPQMQVGYTVVRQKARHALSAESTAQDPRRHQVEYRIVAGEGGAERSSDLRVLDLNHLFLNHMKVQVTVLEQNRYQVNVEGLKPGEAPECRRVAGVTARGVAGGQTVVEQPVQAAAAEFTADRPLDRLDLVVRYSGGQEEVHAVPLDR